MTTHTGHNATIFFGATEVGELDGWSITENALTAQKRAMKQNWDDNQPTGAKNWSGSMTVYLNEADVGQTALSAGAVGEGKFYTKDEQAGSVEYSGQIVVQTINRAPAKEGMVMATITFIGSGALTPAVIT